MAKDGLQKLQPAFFRVAVRFAPNFKHRRVRTAHANVLPMRNRAKNNCAARAARFFTCDWAMSNSSFQVGISGILVLDLASVSSSTPALFLFTAVSTATHYPTRHLKPGNDLAETPHHGESSAALGPQRSASGRQFHLSITATRHGQRPSSPAAPPPLPPPLP